MKSCDVYFQGDYLTLKGSLGGRVLFAGSLSKCMKAEKYVEAYVAANKEADIKSDDILQALSSEDEENEEPSPGKKARKVLNRRISNREERDFYAEQISADISTESRKNRVIHTSMSKMVGSEGFSMKLQKPNTPASRAAENLNDDLSEGITIPQSGGSRTQVKTLRDRASPQTISTPQSVSSQPRDTGSEICRLVEAQSDTNRLLRRMVKQGDEIISLLKSIFDENQPLSIPSGESDMNFTSIDGSTFSVKELSRLNPNSFAISFMKKKYKEDFGKIILDPSGPTENETVRSDIVDELKIALAANFRSYIYSKVRKSVNQAARDIRKKHH